MALDSQKYNVLILAGKDRQDGETVTQAFDRLWSLVNGGEAKSTKTAEAADEAPKARKRRKSRKPREATPEALALLKAMIAKDINGQPFNLKIIAADWGQSPSTLSRYSKQLQRLGFITMVGYGRWTGWQVLKFADGSDYVRAKIVPPGEAQGYGEIRRSQGNGAAMRTNAAIRNADSVAGQAHFAGEKIVQA